MLDLMANNVPDGCDRSIYTIAGMRNASITITTEHRSPPNNSSLRSRLR